jgi:hypothetical protein
MPVATEGDTEVIVVHAQGGLFDGLDAFVAQLLHGACPPAFGPRCPFFRVFLPHDRSFVDRSFVDANRRSAGVWSICGQDRLHGGRAV